MQTVNPAPVRAYPLSFDGALLQRGFWIYVYRVTIATATFLYVGCTGDSSSTNAASPFARLGRHLDVGKNAKANTLVRRLREQGVNPDSCHYELIALGPLFPERKTKKLHRVFRDKTASLERGLADELKRRRYQVLGSHPKVGKPDMRTLKRLVAAVERRLRTSDGNRGQ